MNNLELTAALATAPSSAFADLRERPRFVFPLLLVMLTSAAIVFWYYSVVDIDWYKQTVLASAPKFQQMDEDKRAAALSIMTGTTLKWGSTVAVLLLVPVMFLMQSLLLWVAARVTRLPQGFKHWFALVCWTSLPVLLGTIVAAILLFLNDSPQVAPGVLQQLSLNELVFHVPPHAPGFGLISSLSIPAFLGWGLMIIGVHTWSQRSWAFSAAFILVLVAIVYAVWAFFSFR
jgi:hypothetical protein